jgi:predicted ATP-dependent endonuclease of OLD family
LIEQVSFRNFMALREVDVDLEPFTVLVGPNASGKTSILSGIQLLTNGFPEDWKLNGRLVDSQKLCGPQQEHYEISLVSKADKVKIHLGAETSHPEFNFLINKANGAPIEYKGTRLLNYEGSLHAIVRTEVAREVLSIL